MKKITELKNIQGKRVILRADFNVPVKDGKIVDTLRIKKTLPTIQLLQKKGAIVIILAHMGEDGKESLLPVSKFLNKHVPHAFVTTEKLENIDELTQHAKPGAVILVENIRRFDGEKENNGAFAKRLATLGDIYINDAFPVSHREHASVVGVAKLLPSYGGLQLIEEVEKLSVLLKAPKTPFLVIIGGAKFETKLPLIKTFLKQADHVFVGGALANDLLKVAGYEVGKSLVEDSADLTQLLKNKKLLLQIDVEVKRGNTVRACSIEDIKKDEVIIDAGPETTKALAEIVAHAKTVLWNGPLGKYEGAHGKAATLAILRALAKNEKCYSVLGGGDVTAVSSKAIEDKLSFVSTGGGATLEFLAKGTLPGIKALK